MTEEESRLEAAREGRARWRRWGPYVAERQWGTVREDYSAKGTVWEYLPHDHARSRAYRWGEDGIAGVCDDRQQLCFALALWNGADPILKERMFGLGGPEGNHGEDVKEYYFYLDNVPSHAYMKYLYKYPQRAYPYADLVAENARRTRQDPEYELMDTGIFADDRYFDVLVEYAKADPDDILVRISIANRGPDAAIAHLLPTLWFKNDWSWFPRNAKPRIAIERSDGTGVVLKTAHRTMEPFWLYCEPPQDVLFTDNDTNSERLFGVANASPYVKDAFHEFVVHGRHDAVEPGTRRYQGRALLRAGDRPRRHDRDPAAARPARRSRCAAGSRIRPAIRAEAAGGRRVLSPCHAVRDARRHAPRPAPGLRRHAVDEAVLPLHGPPLARRRSRRTEAARRAAAGAQPRMAALFRGRRAVDARQMGVPVVRGLGHGVPHRRLRDDRSRFREGPAAPAPARVVHAPERPDPGLRVVALRRQPAGARMGGDPRLPDRRQDVREERPRVPRTRVPEAAAQLHVVGQPQGRERQQHLRRRLSRARQHRALRPHRGPSRRRAAGAGRWHELDGDVLPQSPRHLARARARGSGVRGHRHQVLRALRLHRCRGQPDGRRRGWTLERSRRLLFRPSAAARRTLLSDRRAHDRGTGPGVRGRGRRPGHDARLHRFHRTLPVVRPLSPRAAAGVSPTSPIAASRTESGSRWSTRRDCAESSATCSTRRDS